MLTPAEILVHQKDGACPHMQTLRYSGCLLLCNNWPQNLGLKTDTTLLYFIDLWVRIWDLAQPYDGFLPCDIDWEHWIKYSWQGCTIQPCELYLSRVYLKYSVWLHRQIIWLLLLEAQSSNNNLVYLFSGFIAWIASIGITWKLMRHVYSLDILQIRNSSDCVVTSPPPGVSEAQ